MEPLLTNTPSNKCPISICSNCVPFNGTPILCIPNCVGDTVSNVLYKIGQKTCYLQSLLDFTKIDMSCCFTPCPSCQNPTDPFDVMQIAFNCICALQTRVATLEANMVQLKGGVSPGSGVVTDPPILPVPGP